ncbi:hypothetical protein [Corynebacterium lactis]|uniref:Uncharacterized protein n=1 Tax=Corynebacterium lactis RW2-5 TaxID=1408189 RepID=A0A0K2H328_9CORY|nr:hypothetical protein [Corynebacterium lactis]ALA68455.1 hypothetical protein CLAC_03490 [Corynebacterium lactis RW2-5]
MSLLDSMGLGRDLRDEGAVGQFETAVAAPAVTQAAGDWDRQMLGPLRQQQDYLAGVRGYCAAYMSKNINGEWGPDNTRKLPFDAQHGEGAKGAHVDPEKGGIVFDEPGVWLVSLYTTARWTAYTASWLDTDSVRVTMRAKSPKGQVFDEKILQHLSGKSAVSPTITVPMVVKEAGSYIEVEGWSSRYRWWDGGTKFSMLTVVKQDNRPEKPGALTVSDERKETSQ